MRSSSAVPAAVMTEPYCRSCPSSNINHAQQLNLRPHHQLSLVPPSACHRRRHRPPRVLRLFRILCRTLPVFTAPKSRVLSAPCGLHMASCSTGADALPSSAFAPNSRYNRHNHQVVTGTLFGYRRGRVSFSIQENPHCLPSVVVELPMQTHALLREMGFGTMRIALEWEKKPSECKERPVKLLEEPIWMMFCNGKMNGYSLRREASEEDLAVMETLKTVAMGAGVMPGKSGTEGPEGELAFVRAGFEKIVGSKDSETLYMINPNNGDIAPDLTIFFVRI